MDIKDIWWTSLKVTEKERIAFKVTGKTIYYPECTDVWTSLDEASKQKIYDHCTKAHGLELGEWNEGNPYGD